MQCRTCDQPIYDMIFFLVILYSYLPLFSLPSFLSFFLSFFFSSFLPSVRPSFLPSFLPFSISFLAGTRGFESEEKERPQFEGDKAEPQRRSFVTNRRVTYFPETMRRVLRVVSTVAIVFTIALVLAFFGAVFYAEYIVTYKFPAYKFRFFDWGVAIFIAIMIEVFSHFYPTLSGFLADNENHRTETNYEESLISKTLFFKIFNHYGPVLFTVFGKGPLLGEHTVHISNSLHS